MRDQMAGGQFAHLTGADDEHVFALKRAEDFLRQFYSHRRDGNRRRSYFGFRAHSLGDGEGTCEELIELSAHGADRSGRCIRLFYLP